MDTNIYKYKYISSATTTTFGTKPTGVLHTVVVGESPTTEVVISDVVGTIATLKSGIAEKTYTYDVSYTGSLTATSNGISNITINYK